MLQLRTKPVVYTAILAAHVLPRCQVNTLLLDILHPGQCTRLAFVHSYCLCKPGLAQRFGIASMCTQQA